MFKIEGKSFCYNNYVQKGILFVNKLIIIEHRDFWTWRLRRKNKLWKSFINTLVLFLVLLFVTRLIFFLCIHVFIFVCVCVSFCYYCYIKWCCACIHCVNLLYKCVYRVLLAVYLLVLGEINYVGLSMLIWNVFQTLIVVRV